MSQLKFHKTHRMKEIDYRKSFCCNATIKFHLEYAQTGSIKIYYLLVGCKVFRTWENQRSDVSFITREKKIL